MYIECAFSLPLPLLFSDDFVEFVLSKLAERLRGVGGRGREIGGLELRNLIAQAKEELTSQSLSCLLSLLTRDCDASSEH